MPTSLHRVLVALTAGALLLAPAVPASAAPRVSGADLLTPEEMAQGSTREGWRVVDQRMFDCGTYGVMTSGASDRVRRDFMSEGDASGLSFAASFHGRDRARKAFRRVLSAVRTCFGSSGWVKVRADEEVAGPGRIRVVQLFFRTVCCASDTHTFGIARRGNRTAVVKIGEMGRSPVDPMRDVARLASEKLAR